MIIMILQIQVRVFLAGKIFNVNLSQIFLFEMWGEKICDK